MDEISSLFKEETRKTFSKNVVFAFLCGSYARNKFKYGSDVDMFICVKKRSKKREKQYRSWYLSLHKRLGLKPDHLFFYEIVEPRTLASSINRARASLPAINITDKTIYDGIVWAGMLFGKCTGFIGDRNSYLKFRKRAEEVMVIWKRVILKQLKHLPPDQFLKLTTNYGGHGN